MFKEAEITLNIKKRSNTFSIFLAATAGIIGVTVLIGWQFDLEILKRIIPGLVAMNPATAICFMLSGIAIIITNKKNNKKFSGLSKVLALSVFLIGLSSLIVNLFEIPGGVDQWLYKEKLMDKTVLIQNRMAPNTAFNFILSGLAIFLLSSTNENANKGAQSLALFSAFISLLSLIGYVYGVRAFYGVLTYIPMALNTTINFLLINMAVLLATFNQGIIGRLSDNYVGSSIARKLIPAIIIVPIVLGFVILYGEKKGLYSLHFGMALFTVANIIIFIYLIKKIQTSVNEADIARTAVEQKLKESNDKLRENAAHLAMINSELEAFSYTISHDLKTPLTAIEGFARLLDEDYKSVLGKDGGENLDAIINRAAKMRTLIDDLLEFSHIQRKKLQNTPCNMDAIVKKVLKDQLHNLNKKEYAIKIGDLLACQGDANMLEQVWVNLISNAIKYSSKKEKPQIEIGSYKDDQEITYFIKDNGDGFDMKNSDKLFLVFQRFHTQNEFEGTGIGLAIVHKIISRHGGKIWADAKKNEGASFYFSMPLSAAH